MADVKSIDLDKKFEIGPLWFSRAEWWDDQSRFVLVRYSISGKEETYGLCLDMDKRIFLDHIPNPEWDKFARYVVRDIWNSSFGSERE